jgi:NADPH-dependent 2,4-dienoyl-CoA reductase/sulfur reductase-like enzyme
MRRREFSACLGLSVVPAFPVFSQEKREIHADVAIIGGGMGGCSAALACLQQGLRVILTEPTDWIGGQLTSQAVPPDEHRWIETHGANRTYRELRNRIREYYRQN